MEKKSNSKRFGIGAYVCVFVWMCVCARLHVHVYVLYTRAYNKLWCTILLMENCWNSTSTATSKYSNSASASAFVRFFFCSLCVSQSMLFIWWSKWKSERGWNRVSISVQMTWCAMRTSERERALKRDESKKWRARLQRGCDYVVWARGLAIRTQLHTDSKWFIASVDVDVVVATTAVVVVVAVAFHSLFFSSFRFDFFSLFLLTIQNSLVHAFLTIYALYISSLL